MVRAEARRLRAPGIERGRGIWREEIALERRVSGGRSAAYPACRTFTLEEGCIACLDAVGEPGSHSFVRDRGVGELESDERRWSGDGQPQVL